MNVPFIWGMRNMKWSWNLWYQDKPLRINIGWRENRKRKNRKGRNINCRRKGNWRKRKGSKDKDDGKGSREIRCFIEGHPCLVSFVYEIDNITVSQRLVEKLQLPTSFHSNQARIKFSTWQCVKAWLHFKALNLDELSLYLRHEGHEMKLKFMTPREASLDQHRLKEKIEKEIIEKEQI